MAETDREWMSTGEVAERAGTCAKTVTRWALAGRLPHVRTMGGHFRFRRDIVEELVPDVSLLMTPAEVAAVFHVHRYTVTKWGRQGRLTRVLTLGGNNMFWRSEVEALLRGDGPKAGEDR